MAEPVSASRRLTAELRTLYVAAGRPPRKALVRWGAAQEPPVALNEKTLSDWLSPDKVSVPSDERTLLELVRHLQLDAGKAGYRGRSAQWWTRLRRQAWAETHTNPGGRPRRTAPTPAPLTPSAASNLPLRNPAFTGRVSLLARVGAELSSGPVAVVAVRGLGGVGKSQAALEYAHRGGAAGVYDVTWWVRAETDLTVAEDLAGLAPALGVPAGTDQEETVAGVRAALQQRERWLLVFDNAPSATAVRQWLPGGPGHVLITSRDRGWAGVARQMDVEAFDRTESLEYLRTRLGRDDPDAGALAGVLGNLPLALAQAASWIDLHGDPPVGRYLAVYREQAGAAALLAEAVGDGYPHTVATTWLIHFTDLAATAPAALELLRLCAHLDPDDIDLTLLLSRRDLLQMTIRTVAWSGTKWQTVRQVLPTGRLAAAAATARGREDAVGALARTGLVDRLDGDRVHLHRLVAEITRLQIRQHAPRVDDETANSTTDPAASAWALTAMHLILGLLLPEPWITEAWPTYLRLAPHAAAAVDHAAAIGGPTPAMATILVRVGQYQHARGDYTRAHATLQSAVAVAEAVYGPDHPEVARILDNLGNLQRRMAELPAARATLERVMAILTKAYGRNHLKVAITLTRVGAVEQLLDRLHAARASLKSALTIFEAECGPHHPDVAVALGNLGIVQHRLGDPHAARASQERAVAILKAAHGPDHPDLAIHLTNLGIVQADLKELDAALASQERALAIMETAHGTNHPDVAVILIGLGNVQRKLGELQAALASHGRALIIMEAAHGLDHPEVARTLVNLSIDQQEVGELPAARTGLERALAIYEGVYGPEHPRVARTRRRLADLDDPPGV